MKTWLFIAFSGLTLAACAGLDSGECRNANWYDVGFRDALFGMQRQDDVYSGQCRRHGGQIDLARYAEGWQEGKYEFDRRTIHGGEE
jgi:Protein of unknown function (DUF2799)